MIWILLRKDIVQHARALVALAASALALPLVFALLAGPEKDSAGYVGFVFGYLGISAPMMFAQWFIGQEKIKGTFRVLRLLPVSGTRIIVTKCMGAMLLCLLLINITLILEPAVCRASGIGIAQPMAALVLWTNAVAVLSLSISMALFAALDTRIAIQAVIWTLCGFMILGYGAQRYLGKQGFDALTEHAGTLAGDIGLLCIAILPLALVALLLIGLSAWLFERKEWTDLEEN
ncbi:MAG: ABC transporter permease [Acidobacteriota bacterium]|jgi:ABC-type transport system involved in multi-copper enzyme maturation permease subunit